MDYCVVDRDRPGSRHILPVLQESNISNEENRIHNEERRVLDHHPEHKQYFWLVENRIELGQGFEIVQRIQCIKMLFFETDLFSHE